MALDGASVIELLKKNLSAQSQFAVPPDPQNSIGNARWTTYKAPSFSATVKPANVADIQSAIKYATENGIPFHVTATGHHFTGMFEKMKNVLEIDISSLKDIKIDKAANTMTIGGAVRTSIGGCSTTGIVGVTLGGGLNRWQGLYGLMIDNLLSVEMITATGELVKASAKENQELFWGLRGAGFNFGTVVSATYKIYDARSGGDVLIADMILPYTVGSEIMRILKGWEENQPPALSVAVVATWNDEAGGPCFRVGALYVDGIEEGKKHLQPFLDLQPMVQDIRPIPWNEVNKKWLFGIDAMLGAYGKRRIFYSGHIRRFDNPTFEWHFAELVKLWEKYPAARHTLLVIEDWATKAAAEVPDDETAYPHRDIICHMLLIGQSTDPALEPMLEEWLKNVRARYQATSGSNPLQVYISYASGDEDQETLYGKSKLDRLRGLKRNWDPKGVFNFNNPIII
ncbi:FAD-binding domain-containing protein [Rhizodiscina lignyota]|uniref:FAD-binding domain-containing protein n=1 Tax=Rhizodiscina lignyota TaxID=1504668 RepID=A0A9P4I7K2_9PEZI|nr:FAD-binding domain-containing protein [Rhizodiscina lignyota]